MKRLLLPLLLVVAVNKSLSFSVDCPRLRVNEVWMESRRAPDRHRRKRGAVN